MASPGPTDPRRTHTPDRRPSDADARPPEGTACRRPFSDYSRAGESLSCFPVIVSTVPKEARRGCGGPRSGAIVPEPQVRVGPSGLGDELLHHERFEQVVEKVASRRPIADFEASRAPRAADLPASRAPRAAPVNSSRSTVAGTPGWRIVALPAPCSSTSTTRPASSRSFGSLNRNQPTTTLRRRARAWSNMASRSHSTMTN